jgi:UDP-N-acetylmuramoyl-L-alanyl-D-glutamate--2,6-diaminopimelate ligase
MTIRLRALLAALPGMVQVQGDGDTLISAPVTENASQVETGGVFVARKGLSTDGHRYIPQAIERGAAAIVGQEPLSLSVPYVQVENPAEALGRLAAAYHDYPSRRMTIIGVTGTDGKTTTSTLLHRILSLHTGQRAGLISTISADTGTGSLDTGLHVTTPDAPQIQAILAQMLANGLTHVVLEMTSHGLVQGRLTGVDIDTAVITNLTHEHLDYHGTFEAYREAKGRMFAMLGTAARKPGIRKQAVVNRDDANAEYFLAFPADEHVTYGLSAGSQVTARDVTLVPGGTHFNLHLPERASVEVRLPLAGLFNVMNALAASAAAFSLAVDTQTITEGIAQVHGVSGRLEPIDEGQPFLALVDFAHTPNALENALQAARTMTGAGGRVIAVFGCAGLRDRLKRQMMPEIAVRLADYTIMTAEDPRTESLDAILDEMAVAARAAGGAEGAAFVCVPDRGDALAEAVRYARAGDVVIACGKGHEQSMCFGTVEYPWDDRDAMRAALRGNPLRTLPTASG